MAPFLMTLRHETDWRTVVNGIVVAILLAIITALGTYAANDRNRIAEIQQRNVERIAVLEQRIQSLEAETGRVRDRVDALELQVIALHRSILDTRPKGGN